MAVQVATVEPRVHGQGVLITGPMADGYADILTPFALDFIAQLHHSFEWRRRKLLAAREEARKAIAGGHRPDFLRHTWEIRDAAWTVAPIPADLADRRVEITGPVDRKMVINALNSGANVYMADFEDSHSPTWAATIDGQINLRDAVEGSIALTTRAGKHYTLGNDPAVLFVRPRGWHLSEKHVIIDGTPVSASLFDFGLFFFHNARRLVGRGTGPYFYLPKLENHLEARLWNDVFVFAQDYLDLPRGTIRATVLIENILAAFEMDEILWELKEHSAGLNCGRWDYIFSFIKTFGEDAGFLLPDRAQVTMRRHFLRTYTELVIKTCHRRGIHAMGGMAAQIPIKNDPAANADALDKVRQDKLREVEAGHDGTWVAHPGLVPVAKAVFDQHMPGPNQIHRTRDDVVVTAEDLLRVPDGTITAAGLRQNIDVGIQYLEAWLRGTGCVPLYHLMEDAATAEISRCQVWQWLRHRARLDDGREITTTLVKETILEVLGARRSALGADGFPATRFVLAARLYEQMMTSRQLPEWLTTVAYEHLD